MSYETLIRCCAPTMACLKTGNMFSCVFDSREQMTEELRHLNQKLGKKGLRILPLRWRDGKALLYLYRPGMLARDLRNPLAQSLLSECGGGPAAAQAPWFIIDSGLRPEDISFDGKAVVLNGADLADFMANIRHVQILAEGAEKPVEQEIVGHHGTVGSFIALDENGVLNADGVVKARNGSESPLFEAGTKYTVTVAAFGYPELTFPYEKAE